MEVHLLTHGSEDNVCSVFPSRIVHSSVRAECDSSNTVAVHCRRETRTRDAAPTCWRSAPAEVLVLQGFTHVHGSGEEDEALSLVLGWPLAGLAPPAGSVQPETHVSVAEADYFGHRFPNWCCWNSISSVLIFFDHLVAA